MATNPARMSVEEYLETSYEPECEYLDGELIPKAMGTNEHGRLQFRLARLLYRYEEAGLCEVVTEQSVRVRAGAILIPDVCVLHAGHGERGIVTKPALICIEVLSPSDRFAYTVRKCEEYIEWGTQACWVFDPLQKRAWVHDAGGLRAAPAEGVLWLGEISLSLQELWA